jgi:hypothetical protein
MGRQGLSESVPKLTKYGVLRLVRDVLGVSGKIEMHSTTSHLKRMVLNRAAPLAEGWLTALRDLLLPQQIVLVLGET